MSPLARFAVPAILLTGLSIVPRYSLAQGCILSRLCSSAFGANGPYVKRHDLVATISYTLNACVILFVALTTLPVYILIPVMGCAGFLSGSITASRDMMVRKAAPAGAIGRAFGLVSTGFNFGGIIAPPMYGWIMDQNMPHWVLITTAICMVLTSATTIIADNVRRRAVAAAA